jgi:deazaflavin-dependent oxidoreductase (nitroreductase family)
MAQSPPSTTPAAAPPRRPPKALFRYVLNPLFGRILRSPLHGRLSERLALLTFIGRKSGKTYTIPVGYAQTDDTLLIGTASAWQRNLVGGAPVRVRLRGQERTGVADVVADEAGMIEHYRTMLNLAPGFGRAVGLRLDPNGDPNREDVARNRAQGHVVVSIKLDPPEGASSA